MPSISKIRLANIIYEEGNKRYNDEIFLFDGHNGAVLLENGGGKTVLIQTALQAMIPHTELASRKIANTLTLQNEPAHIAVEWIINENPRRYLVTAVTLTLKNHSVDSIRYAYEYGANDPHRIEEIPFIREVKNGKRAAERGEMQDYYSMVKEKTLLAYQAQTIKEYRQYIEENYQIIATEWDSIVKINSTEGGVETFFEECRTTNQLFDRLLIPIVENSMAGHEKSIFVDQFEQRYTSFQRYQELNDMLKENEKIQQELVHYSDAFEKLHQKEQAFLLAKQKTKGIWEQILQQKADCQKEKERNDIDKLALEKDQHSYQVKRSSLQIAKRQEEMQEVAIEYQNASGDLDDLAKQLQDDQKEFASLRYAKLADEKQEAEEAFQLIKERVATMEETTDITEVHDALEETKQALHGYYMSKFETIANELQAFQQEMRPLEDQLKVLEKHKDEHEQAKQQSQNEILRLTSAKDRREEDADKLRQRVLANPDQENMEEQINYWEKRHQALDEEVVALQTEQTKLKREQKEKLDNSNHIQIEIQDKELALQRFEQYLIGMEEEEQELIQKLALLRNAWQDIDRIHLQQQSIESQLINQLEKSRVKRNEIKVKERLAYRYVDDYGNQDVFFSDPFIIEKIASWKNQFDYLETGIDYVNQLPESKQRELSNYPLWASVLVTTEKAKPQVMKKIEQVRDRLYFPIIVVSTEEALTIHATEKKALVVPYHWQENQDEAYFEAWKQQLSEQAKEISNEHKQIEQEMNHWGQTLSNLREFLQKYSYERVEEWKESKHTLQNEKEQLDIQAQHVKKRLEDIGETIEKHDTEIKEAQDERNGLELKLHHGHEYLRFQEEIKGYQERIEREESKKQETEYELRKVRRSVTRYQEKWEELRDRTQSIEVEKHTLEQDRDYKQVRDTVPIFTGEPQEILITKWDELKLDKEKISRQMGEWLEKQENKRLLISFKEESMTELEKQYPLLDKKYPFPTDGDSFIRRLETKIAEAKKQKKDAEAKFQKANNDRIEKETLLHAEKDSFHQTFPHDEIILFEQELKMVADQLRNENQVLSKRKAYLDQEGLRISQEFENVEETERLLENFIEGYHFNAPGIASISLAEKEAVNFQYHRKEYAKNITEELRAAKQQVETEEQQVMTAKEDFRTFCRNEITDKKLQQRAINGVEQKRSYDEVMTYKQHMFSRIKEITKYANEHIRKNDEELQLFITQIHTHLQMLVDELAQIPKKTKVKVDEVWKQIYNFSIPEWEQEDGKLRIREYTEWIIRQLDQERYLNDLGQKDMGKVRADVEKWLDSKQLLKVVMKNEVVKVHCRKVTNDNQVTTRSYSWEQSNVWSGGEKWSKNMTLFLGIQKYVAEKRTAHLTDRVVILDNPFGKASSDHVLSPVFFVAEQLGFQIIALTAHAEGKFLQDYFPIIYSCRLRPAKDQDNKVMTTRKELHRAYFHDHEPSALERLGETEQLDMLSEWEGF